MKNLHKNSMKNGKKGGRPKINTHITSIAIPGVDTVILTEYQYDTLIQRYGELILNKALKILDSWLISSPYAAKYKGKNNYAHFRSDGWVINAAKVEVEPTLQT